MGSSPGFGSTPCDYPPYSDSLSLRLRVYAPLTSPQRVTRWLILQKARGQALLVLRQAVALPLLVGTRFQVLFHSGYPGSFHLSLAVLVHYRSLKVFSLGRVVPPASHRISVPRGTQVIRQESLAFRVRDSHPLRYGPFQCRFH